MNDSTNKPNPKFLYFSDEELKELQNGLDELFYDEFFTSPSSNRILHEEIEKTLKQRGAIT